MTLAEKIKELRKKKAWSQEQLAEVSDLSVKTIQRTESGNHNTAFESQLSLAQAFDMEVSELVYPKNSEDNKKSYILEIILRRRVYRTTVAFRNNNFTISR